MILTITSLSETFLANLKYFWVSSVIPFFILSALFFLAAPVLAQTIQIAHIAPFTGPAASDARELNTGILASLAETNRAGGIKGKKIALLTLDDKYSGEQFEQMLNIAMEKNPIALLAPLGLAQMRQLLDKKLLDKHDLVVVNAIPGATPFRSPGHEKLFHVRASDKEQLEKIFQHVITLGISNIHVLLQDMKAGGEDLRSAKNALLNSEKLNLEIEVLEQKQNTFAEYARKAMSSDTQSILVLGSPPYMAQAISELRKAGLSKPIFALSHLPPSLVLKLSSEEGARGVSISQTYPSPMGRNLPLQRQFQAAMRATFPDIKVYSSFQFEGYISAKVLEAGVKRISGPINPSTLTLSFKKMGAIDLGGFWVDFSKNNSGSRFVDLAIISQNGRLLY